MKRALSFFLILCLMAPLFVLPAAAENVVAGPAASARSSLAAKQPVLRADGHWAVLAMARSGHDTPRGYYASYRQALRQQLEENGGRLRNHRAESYALAVLALTAIGEDPTAFAGVNLLAPLADFDFVTSSGAAAYALLALDCHSYSIASDALADPASRERYVSWLLQRQLSDGGWAAEGSSASVQTTAIVLQAMANYRDDAAVKAAAERGLQYLASLQNETGGFSTAADCAQVLLSLCALNVRLDDPRFTKEGRTVLDALLAAQLADGSFGDRSSGTDQATAFSLLALAAVQRSQDKEPAVYDMSDAKGEIEAVTPQSGVLPRSVTRPGVSFADVQSHRNRHAIETLASYGVIDGMGGGRFAPDETMTRAQFAAIVVRGLGLTAQFRGTFTDVPETAWYAGFVDTAAAYGIVNGVGHGAFAPDSTITRQEAATMLARAAALCGFDTALPAEQAAGVLASYPDGGSVAPYAQSTMAFCAQYAILPADDASFAPDRAILRCEVAQMLYNLLVQTPLLP